MKFINPLRNIIMLIVLLTITHASLVMGNDRIVGDQYAVKINNVLLRRDVAESVLLRVKDECKCSGIPAYDNTHNRDIMLSEIAENMDVRIMGSELLSKLEDMYNDLNNGVNIQRMSDMTCVYRKLNIKAPKKIKMCADEDSIVVYLMIHTTNSKI